MGIHPMCSIYGDLTRRTGNDALKILANESEYQNDHKGKQKLKHTTGGIPRWSPTLVLVARFSAYVWQSGRDAQFSLTYGRMCWLTS
jgi:hypothetical protein